MTRAKKGIFIPPELDDLGLDPFALRLYTRIAMLHRLNGVCDEGIDKMAAHCRISRQKAYQSIKLLVSLQIVEKIPIPGSPSHYRPTNPSQWLKTS